MLSLPVLVQLDRRDNDVAWVNANGSCGTIRLVTLDAVDVDDPLLTVNLSDLALPTLVFAANNSNFIVFADG